MSENQSSNKRIAKNTLALYVRMFISMSVGLYTSRVIINVLGVEDYGIYGVVGGIVGMLGFLNATMSGATSRFITYELGRNDDKKLADTFSSALYVHGFISLFVVLIAETIGLWFLNTQLIIPDERMNAAHWLYQFSIISSVLTIMQVPYNATIMSHEKMDIYAYIEILNVVIKLLIVFLIQIVSGDKLIIYAGLYLVASFFIFSIYVIYCRINFMETRPHILHDKAIIKPMMSFSGWDLFGNFAGVARQQGVNMVINIFWGPLLNAASSIATTVSGIIMQFATNIVIAVKPPIIKSYAKGDFQEMEKLIMWGSALNFILLSMLSVPLIIKCEYVLGLWLGLVPDYAVVFCQLSLIFNLFANQSVLVITGVHATGKIKATSIILGTLYILVVPITYLCFKFNFMIAWIPYAINVIAVFCGMSINAYMLHRYIPQFSFSKFLGRVISKYLIPFIIILIIVRYVDFKLDNDFTSLLIVIILSVCLFIMSALLWTFPADFRKALLAKIYKSVNNKCKKI